MSAWLWDEIHEQFRKFFLQDRLKGDVLATEFFEGDTVTLTGTIGGKSSRLGHQLVVIDGRIVKDPVTVANENVRLVKRAAPPEPPIGTVMTYFSRNNKWVRTTDGWHFIRQGDGFLSGHENNGSGAKWETFQHEGVKVIG